MADGLIQRDNCILVAKPHPLRSDAYYAEVQAGQTIADMLGPDITQACEVQVGGYTVPRALWAHVKPKAGQFIHVQVFPQGGGAGKWIRTILLIVVAIVAIVVTDGAAAGLLGSAFAAGTTGAAILGAAIGIVGAMLVNALIPPPTPKGLNGGNAASDPFQQLNSITGTSNQANPYGVIPCVVGTMRFFPPHAAMPFTEILGDDQYLRMLLDLGYGDLDISDIQIGGTDISTFDDVEYQVGTNPSLFTQDVDEATVGVDMTDLGDTATRTTQIATNEISLDLVFSQGLFGVDTQGHTVAGNTSFTIQYAPTGTGTWTNVATLSGLTCTNGLTPATSVFNLTSSARKTLRAGVRWKVTAGQYDVKVTRNSTTWPGSAGASAQIGQCTWTVLRSFSYQNPSTTGTTKLAVRIKATDQLQGIISNLSVLASQQIPQWAFGSWTADAPTQNPAWIYAWLLTRCPAVLRRLDDSRLDLDGIAEWAQECDDKGLVCSFVMDSPRALFDVIRDVLAAGRASFGMRNALYSAVRDLPQTVPVQMFTPANSWDFSYTRAFTDLPHAFRVKFTNPEANYQQDEILAYADGYNADGSGGKTAASRFEELDLQMVTDPIAAWKIGVYQMAVAYNRPNTYTFNADIESIVCERGDLINVAHDITGWGTAWGRIKAVTGTTVTLDGPVTLESGKSYRIRCRHSDGTQTTANITNTAGTYTTLNLDTGTPTAQAAAANAAALADIASGGTDFYAEIGPASGSLLWNNGGVGYGGGTVVASTPVAYASVTKTLSACVALTTLGSAPSTANYKLLCMTSGYDLMQGSHCLSGDTVHSCAITPHSGGVLAGVQYTHYNAAHDGLFSYDSAHWQYLFDTVLGLGADNVTTLANLYISQFSLTAGTLACTSPMPAGGARSTGNVLRKIAQQICTGTGGGAAMKAHQLNSSYAPVDSTNLGAAHGSVFYSPGPLNVPMHYKSGLWIQDSTGDYFMAGSAGTVVWIKSDFSMYGMVVRNGGAIDGALSMQTMWNIRDAYLNAGEAIGDVGDLFVIGEVATEVSPLIVKQISPSDDLSAQITAVDYSTAVLNADTQTPPTFVSSITGQAWCDVPPVPDLSLIVSAAPTPINDGGNGDPEVGISIPGSPGILRPGYHGGGGLQSFSFNQLKLTP